MIMAGCKLLNQQSTVKTVRMSDRPKSKVKKIATTGNFLTQCVTQTGFDV